MSEYDADVYAWSQRQGALLRRLAAGERVNDADLDWPNIAEEIETVGRSERAAVTSHIVRIIEHLIELEASPATGPRAGWQATIKRARIEIDGLLLDSPSIARLVGELVERATPAARRLADVGLAEYGESPRVDMAKLTYTSAQVLGDWFPDAR